MKFKFIHPEDVTMNWEWIREILAPSFLVGGADPDRILDDLVNERSFVFTVGDATTSVLAVLTVRTDDIFSVSYISGTISGGPKKFIKVINEGMDRVCEAAKAGGAKEVRVQGRDWGRFLTGFRLIDKDNNESCKVL